MLGRVRFVDNDQPTAVSQLRRTVNRFRQCRECLQRTGQNALALGEIVVKFLGLGRVVTGDVDDHAFRGLEQRESIRHVLIQHGAIRDDDYTIKKFRPVFMDHLVGTVRQPCNGFRLA